MKTSALAIRTAEQSENEPMYLPPSPPASHKPSDSDDSDSASERSEETYDLPVPPPSTYPMEVLELDKNTPDAHVVRDPRLIRLTGVHPFNTEAPLSALYDSGFLTPQELFYVRNHGPVPKVEDSESLDWTFTIDGLVDNPVTLSVRDLQTEFRQVTIPITLVCAGNRRKEQNTVRKSNGFSWGSAGVSTALWTGVLLSDVLERVRPKRKGRYMCMEGADKLPNGYYGTSVKLAWAKNPEKGMLLAWAMNGEPLQPDHGKPLRVVIPGQIGGRSVKWLKKLTITAAPSDNWYHIYDNRVLPTMVTPAMAKEDPTWWTDERYAIYDLSVNAACAYPAHKEEHPAVTPETDFTYKVQGYAYGGGGRRITRVEISLDKGTTWRLTDITYPEDRYRSLPDDATYNNSTFDVADRETSFCWSFWSLSIPMSELQAAEDVLVRAQDEAMNIMPRDMYWSVLGMMNNPWFRIEVVHEGGKVRFEHPTALKTEDGWMERAKREGRNLVDGYWGKGPAAASAAAVEVQDEVKMTNPASTRVVEYEELVAEREGSYLFVVNGEVYDGASYLEGHPGGAQSIISAAGQDVSEEFLAIHSESAKAMMPTYHIGTLSPAARRTLASPPTTTAISTALRPVFLDPKRWINATLTTKRVVSSDTRIFTFTLEHPDQLVGLPIGQHLMIKIQDENTKETIIRAYTPISCSSRKGEIDLLIKVYFGNERWKGGKMTQAMDVLGMGHRVQFKGPIGKLVYKGRGEVNLSTASPSNVKIRRFNMICGGTGITPIFQVLRAVVQDAEDATECVVLYGNRKRGDILCGKELEELERLGGSKVKLIHTLSRETDPTWKGRRGRVDNVLIEAEVGERREGELVLVCGPEEMEKDVRRICTELGWGEGDMCFF
ncbi:nitrate reductase [Ascobolus immersus RN42]|uniref:Nitrate reductase n=1 Tax=Ascobolus immersus RN42 TaxID=1160509 RepID=A0A3N4HEU5_ASCIM|nr:nitrate reductase [Ascobolus immersus RN42]